LLELKIKTLYTALHDLQVEIEALGEGSDLNPDGGTDFYEEVRRFEIYLIERALAQTKGVQKEAAKILKMRTSTLNQKIKLYNISSKYYAYQSTNGNGNGNGNGERPKELSAEALSL
jgi:DNA-binding NtrC family response regulator